MISKRSLVTVICILINGGFCAENDFETKLKELESAFTSCNASISALQKMFTEELREVRKRESDKISTLEAKVNSSIQHMVGFTVCHSPGNTIGKGQTVVYDTVISNIGNAYDVRDGEFNVPFDGFYSFSLTGMAYSNTDMYFTLVRNGASVHKIYSNGGPADSSTVTINLQLQAGDAIWINNGGSGVDRLHPSDYNCFSGMLVREG